MHGTKVTIGTVAGVTLAGFWYRYLGHHGFSDDHYIHIARAQQWLLGDWPVYDFTDLGAPLTALLSAVALAVAPSGAELWGEVLLTCLGFGVAAGLIALAVIHLGAGPLWAIWAAVLSIVAHPRTYSHPKLWLYPAAVVLGAWYLRAPSITRRAALACFTTFAFLVRHDHGIYIGLGVLAMLCVAHRGDGLRRLLTRGAEFAGIGLLCVSPYLLYLAAAPSGLPGYVRDSLEVNREEARRTLMGWPTLQPSLPAILGLGTGGPVLTINIKWADNVTGAERPMLEQTFGITPLRHLERNVYQYELANATPDRQWAIVRHHAVADTGNLDRSIRPGLAGLVSRSNATTVLYYLHFFVCTAALYVAFSRVTTNTSTAALVLIGVLGLASGIGFLRDPLMQRMADVYGTFPIAAAVLLTFAWGRPRAKMVGLAAAVAVTASTLVLGEAREYGALTGLSRGPGAVKARAREVTRDLRTWPWRQQWPTSDDAWPVVRYVHECTAATDRLLVTWYAPQLYVIAQRQFAGTETVMMPAWRDPAPFESTLARRVMSQAPPIVLVSTDGWPDFRHEYPLLAAHLERSYEEAGVFRGRERPDISVRTLRGRAPQRIDRQTGWPCFTAP